MRRGSLWLFVVVLVAALSGINEAQQGAADVTQWRGANRDGVITGFTAPAAWPENLTQRWKVDVGLGYATPLVVGNRVYVFSRQGEDEVMTGIDAASGKVLWRTAYPAPFEMSSAAKAHGPGPKSTPAFANGRLYAIGMAGHVTAYDAASGKQLTESIGLETLGGVFSPLLHLGCTLPCEATTVFSTAADNQVEISLSLFRGSGELTSQNHPLGRFSVIGLPPRPRGIIRVVVTVRADRQGIILSASEAGGTEIRIVRR